MLAALHDIVYDHKELIECSISTHMQLKFKQK